MTYRLHLDCNTFAAKRARDWLGSRLHGWSPHRVDDAVLVVSELVTNAVLHAQTDVDVVAFVDADTARVEIVDRSPARPMPRHYAVDATTGRGLHLLHSLTARWGVEVSAHAKSVWFEIADPPDAIPAALPTESPAPDLAHWPDLEDLEVFEVETGTPTSDPSRPEMVDVYILGLPLVVFLAAQQHNDALMREFVLLAEYAPPDEVPRRLVELAAEVRRQFGPATTTLQDKIEAAVASKDRTVDLALTVPVAAPEFLLLLAQHLDEADQYCESGDLLTLASPPLVRQFRAWYAQEIADQISGSPPQPWPSAT